MPGTAPWQTVEGYLPIVQAIERLGRQLFPCTKRLGLAGIRTAGWSDSIIPVNRSMSTNFRSHNCSTGCEKAVTMRCTLGQWPGLLAIHARVSQGGPKAVYGRHKEVA